jgi:hypothetical protein
MRWHRDQTALREIGGDFESYRKRIADETRTAALADPEFRKQAMEAWRAEAGGQQQTRPANVTDLPSVNRATGTGGNAEARDDGSDPAAVFSKITRRK